VLRLALAVSVLALLAIGCGSDNKSLSAGPNLDDPGPVHVHGLGVNPKDGVLFIATHTGLFRASEEEQRASRVEDRFQDTMGFTVVGPDHFLGSGHPDLREELPPLLGLIESRDAGRSWQPVSLLGEADFHVLEASDRRVYGFDSRGGRLMVSSNGGRHWTRRPAPEPLISLAIDPSDPERVVASGESELHYSADAGRRWRSRSGEAGLLTWTSADRLYVVGGDGRLRASPDAGRNWRPVGDIGGQPAAFEAGHARDLYAALHDGSVKRSIDGGASWSVRSKP
jgi:hypothetical protein